MYPWPMCVIFKKKKSMKLSSKAKNIYSQIIYITKLRELRKITTEITKAMN